MFTFGNNTGGGAGNTGGNLFGTPSTGAPSTSIFGNTASTSAAPSGGSMFGNAASASAAPSGGSMFGNAASTSTAPSGNIFGGAANTSAAAGSGMFGGAANTSAASNSGGIFGSSANTSTAPASGGIFGGATNTSAAATTGGIFGAAANSSAAPTAGGMFGSTTNTSAAPNTGGMFGSTSNTSMAPASGSIFGNTTNTTTASNTGGIFGNTTNTSAAPNTGGIFGNTAIATAAPTGGMTFGGATSTSAAANNCGGVFGSAPNTSAGGTAITRKTRFVDLPTSVQQQLAAVEKQKHVQMQIGSSIMADETEREVTEVGRAVQRLAQDLQVAKMTLAADRERVEEAKRHVTFAIKHAEKGASLIAHATDDGSWAQSGLTPLQVANRQKALQSRLAEPSTSSSAPLLFQTADGEAADGPLPVDPFEAVRRIQVASMHYDVASEYYWAWLTRVDASAQLLAERLDQLERHVSGAVAQQQSATTESESSTHVGSRLSPKAVSDIIQYQNDSFLAIAGKVAAVDEDVRKLCRRLALKDTPAMRNSS
ncbi:hypothetical protein H4R24_004465 [Coemansia sp. RSA 988]|nr:hypothetical protein H4R24_004465 [Coemansia sp. RSA 988]